MNEYITTLIKNITNTEIIVKGLPPCGNYNERISILVDKFTWHKTQVFFIGNGSCASVYCLKLKKKLNVKL